MRWLYCGGDRIVRFDHVLGGSMIRPVAVTLASLSKNTSVESFYSYQAKHDRLLVLYRQSIDSFSIDQYLHWQCFSCRWYMSVSTCQLVHCVLGWMRAADIGTLWWMTPSVGSLVNRAERLLWSLDKNNQWEFDVAMATAVHWKWVVYIQQNVCNIVLCVL